MPIENKTTNDIKMADIIKHNKLLRNKTLIDKKLGKEVKEVSMTPGNTSTR